MEKSGHVNLHVSKLREKEQYGKYKPQGSLLNTEICTFVYVLITKSKEKIEMICESTTFVLSCCHFSQFSRALPRNFSLRPKKTALATQAKNFKSDGAVFVRITTSSSPSEYFLHCFTEFSFTDGIDDRVAYCT